MKEKTEAELLAEYELMIRLSPRQELVLRNRVLGKTLKEIGADIGVCSETVRRIEGKARKRIQEWKAANDNP